MIAIFHSIALICAQWESGSYKWNSISTKKENPVLPCLRVRPTQIFHFGTYVLIVCYNYVKAAVVGQSQRKLGFNFLKITENLFPTFFLQKTSDFWETYCFFRRVTFVTRKKEKYLEKMSRPTDFTWKVRLPVKQFFFLFFFFFSHGLILLLNFTLAINTCPWSHTLYSRLTFPSVQLTIHWYAVTLLGAPCSKPTWITFCRIGTK